MMTFLVFSAGLVLLVAGAEFLVKGASRLALALGVSPLAVGLTIVAYGTSMPELVVSLKAALTGQPDIAAGNVIGSNIFNVLFVLGVSALAAPLIVTQKLIRIDVPLMVGVSILFYGMSMDGKIGKIDALILTIGFFAYAVFSILESRKEEAKVREEYEKNIGTPGKPEDRKARVFLWNLFLLLGGLCLLVLGAQWLVSSSVDIARHLGVSEVIIGLTLVAIGTSLPEVATSVMATLRGERDIAIGNVVGSNLANILGIIGITGLVAPGGVPVAPSLTAFDLPVMTAVAFACLPIFFTGYRIDRWEGVLFLFYYGAYSLYLYLHTVQHDALPVFNGVMMLFILPLTVLTLGVVLFRTFWKGVKT